MLNKFIPNFKDKILVRLVRENIRRQTFNYSIAIAAMIVVALMTALSAWIMRDIIDSMFEEGNRSKVFFIAGMVALIFTIKGLANYVQVVWLSRAGNSIIAFQQRQLYDRILEHGVSFFNERGSSGILMSVTRSAQAARAVLDTLVMGFVRDLLTLIGLIIVMVYQQPTLSIFALAVGPLAVLGVRHILSKVRHIMMSELSSQAEIIKVVQETSIGIRVVKAFALEENMADRMKAAVATVESRANAISRLQAATSPLMETLSGFAIAAVVALSAVSLFGDTSTTPGELMSFVTALLMAYEPAKRLARMRITIESKMIAVGTMYDILDTPVSVQERPDAMDFSDGPGEIAFKNVSFNYDNGNPLIDQMDVVFQAGKTTALVGPSGGGKSTIINLILRLYDPVDGVIEIDGCDLRQTKFASLRHKISLVGQDTFLFDGSLMYNIRLGREDATDEDVVAAAKAANAHDFIQKMPSQYDTNVGENGGNLSGGQRQRIAIARAILRDSPILVLDEATSALDSESEFLVNEALHRLSENRTTIIIAHRLSTIKDADKIIVVNEGKIAEQGSQRELLSHNGLFRSLYDRQFKTS